MKFTDKLFFALMEAVESCQPEIEEDFDRGALAAAFALSRPATLMIGTDGHKVSCVEIEFSAQVFLIHMRSAYSLVQAIVNKVAEPQVRKMFMRTGMVSIIGHEDSISIESYIPSQDGYFTSRILVSDDPASSLHWTEQDTGNVTLLA